MRTEIGDELRTFFGEYTRLFNEALGGTPDLEAITGQYTSSLLAAGPQGVSTAEIGDEFRTVIAQGYEYYRSIGMTQMSLLGVEVTPIDERHALAKVSYRASYIRVSDGQPVDLEFGLAYLLQKQDRWRVFAFIAGDEQAIHEQHGLVAAE
jgi:hypothetical protein